MKKLIGLGLIVAVLAALAYVYLKEGKTAVIQVQNEAVQGQAEVQKAKQSMNDLNKATEEAQKEADKLIGK